LACSTISSILILIHNHFWNSIWLQCSATWIGPWKIMLETSPILFLYSQKWACNFFQVAYYCYIIPIFFSFHRCRINHRIVKLKIMPLHAQRYVISHNWPTRVTAHFKWLFTFSWLTSWQRSCSIPDQHQINKLSTLLFPSVTRLWNTIPEVVVLFVQLHFYLWIARNY